MKTIIVIGGGLMGSSAAWELSKAGHKVLLIEKQDSNYETGSSLGESRFSHSRGQKDHVFSFLHNISIKKTQELISFLNDIEPDSNHKMEDIYQTSPLTYIYYESQRDVVKQLLQGQHDNLRFASNKVKALELFDMRIPDAAMVIRKEMKYSGTLNPRVLLEKLHQGIVQSGSTIEYCKEVTRLKRNENSYEIQIRNTKTGITETHQSENLIAAAGPYNGRLLKTIAPYFEKLITPQRVFAAFLRIKPKVYEALTEEQKSRIKAFYPVLDMNDEIYFSLIEKYSTEGIPIFKVAGHLLRTEINDLDEVWKKTLNQSEIDWSKNNTARYLMMINLPVGFNDLEYVSGYSCVYSLSKSEVPYVANIYNEDESIDPHCVLIGGMSGTGAKASLGYGLMAANLIMNKEENSTIYKKTKLALGQQRLLDDIKSLAN